MPIYNLIIIKKHLEVYNNTTKMSQMITESFKSKIKIAGNTPADGNTKVAEIIVSFKTFK